MPTGLHCLLVGGIEYWQCAVVKYEKFGMAGSVTQAQSHDECGGTVHVEV